MERYVYIFIVFSILYQRVNSMCYRNKKAFIVHLSLEKQREHLQKAEVECYHRMNLSNTDTTDKARRTCLSTGQWFYNLTTNRTWTDYRDCLKPSPKSIIPSWGCKFLYTLFHYFLTANYTWILTEGVYLHIVIFETTQHKNRLCKLIILSGWCAPLFCVIPWAIVRAVYEDSLCWSTHDDPDKGFYWIIKGPIVASIIINFILFINVIRVLFTKLSAYNIRDPKRYRKLTKATLILIPLFGVHYITFIAIPNCLEEKYQVIRLYVELTLNSFQGFVIALLVCFLNREVRAEFKKTWERHLLRKQSLNSFKSYKSQTEVIKLETMSKPETRVKANLEFQMHKATDPLTNEQQNGTRVAL
ncbi:hypothetical protein KUTeg_008908 [Tegillarca granosa]|uniref:G-protein coupled receptors family 2 profile 2 domain-containing protein n=1 Tax=Tegillarca granosa TaxID=220873 RepID=A0ABQ9FAH4_TEGGR|nr:hypothetical protein KUTeg_008908 [Tegillarca granosa]